MTRTEYDKMIYDLYARIDYYEFLMTQIDDLPFCCDYHDAYVDMQRAEYLLQLYRSNNFLRLHGLPMQRRRVKGKKRKAMYNRYIF